jgi:Trk K+ transport system NAD-binding subunit
VVNRDGKVEVSPQADFEILPGDQLVLLGSNAAIERINDYLTG